MTYEQVLKQIDVNIEETLQRFSGNKELMEKFIKKFPEDNTTEDLENAIKAKDYKAIEDTAHTLKGLSGNLGFSKLFELSSALVNAIRANDFSTADTLSPKVIELSHFIAKAINGIN